MKGFSRVCFAGLLLLALSSCSYRELEDAVRAKVAPEPDDGYVNMAKIPESGESAAPEEGEPGAYSKRGTVGDTLSYTSRVTYTGLENRTMEYTLNSAEVVDTIQQAGLEKEVFSNPEEVRKDGSVVDAQSGAAACKLVVVKLTVKNVDHAPPSPEEETELCMEINLGTKSQIEDPNGPFLLEADYFSEESSKSKEDRRDYNKYVLEAGESMEATLAWIIPEKLLEEKPLYYVLGTESEQEHYSYFDLGV